jgi:hypothetical protein
MCAFRVEANLHSIQAVTKPKHSSNVTLTTVPSIRSTKLHCGTPSTQYLVAKQIQNTKRHNLNTTAAILCNSSNVYWNVCASIKVCFWSYRADKMFNRNLFYKKHWTNRTGNTCSPIAAISCNVSQFTLTQLRPFLHWLHKFHVTTVTDTHKPATQSLLINVK